MACCQPGMNVNWAGELEGVGDTDSTSSGSVVASCSIEEHEEITILCELVGARDLTIRDEDQAEAMEAKSLRPYCLVKFGDRVIHRTKTADDMGNNPIWTVSTKSLFLLKATPHDISNGILSVTLNSERENSSLPARFMLNSRNLFLGQVNLDSSEILGHCDQQRFEVNLEDEMGEESGYLGTLAFRFRIATPSDQKIVRLFNLSSLSEERSHRAFKNFMLQPGRAELFGKGELRPLAKLVTETDETEIAQTSFVNALSGVFTSNRVRDKETGLQKVRVKPSPDPDRQDETTFLSPQDIHIETRRPSNNWVEAGSGTLGKLYCEVLACHDLPNVDVGEALGNVTDSFVSLVYEDTCAMTDVIDDELSPHWLPWSQRAFCFGMMHPASILYLGVFDYDLGTSHEPLGRVAVNVSNLQRNTIHTLKYNLYPSSNVTDRTGVGSVTIRLRIECPDEKAALLAALQPRPKIFVNVQKEKTFKVVRYTCFGEYDGEEKFDLTVTRSYINEIFAFKAALGYSISDAVTSLVLWRGQVEIFSIMVPLHSFLFFWMATDFIEHPYRFVPYTLLCISWVMLANLTIRRQHPSPWHKCPSFWHYLHVLKTGKAPTAVGAVKEFENNEAAREYEKAWKDRLEHDRSVAEQRWKLQQELQQIGDDNISTKMSQSAIPLDLLLKLARWQGIVGRYCGYFRFMKIILTWEESVVSFWITAGFLAGGIVALLLPWHFIVTWTSRIFVWCFLGPHMKLVDLYMRANRKKDGKLKELVQNFDVQSHMARLRREEAMKAKDIKSIAFGKYSIQVPSFNIARHFDRPLPESYARLCRSMPKQHEARRRVSVVNLNLKNTPWIPGQQLFGAMIPRPEHEALLYNKEVSSHKENLLRFKRIVDEIKGGLDHARRRRISLRKNGLDSHEPISFGYEVIPEEPTEECSSLNLSNDLEKKRISVVLSADDDDVIKIDECEQVLLESDGVSIYEVKSIPDQYKEEGLEVVGLGRYSTLSGRVNSPELELLTSWSVDSVLQRQDSRLSHVYKSSQRIDVAFYSPIEHDTTNEKDILKET